ncbi:MAG TPA: hypoxanthine phosphoribosyltransferase [Leptospiraceae bacterium]|nr:hypoxanthine phosphoribosyltransferase [Spirochaetaceae bacterium]HBS06066.1 hypoxanthine phosphoribosyltransferase [Leptospiraceae bacterium]|tara:strand:- start:591 stop:1124 length:534 start_codon:yes stop_codon:yes gene_type:complete
MRQQNKYNQKVLISQEQIQESVHAMGERIAADYGDDPLTIIGCLKGSFIFMADLVRAIPRPLHIDFIEVSSYGNELSSSGNVRIVKDFKHPVQDSHVLIVEDIVDTGLTFDFLFEHIRLKKPTSLEIAALLVRSTVDLKKRPVKYHGFTIGEEYVVGYGLDAAGLYRNLNHVAVFEQ